MKSSKFKVEFTLKQHTPIIHFQSDHGATLRASELKPKFDRFLKKYAFNDTFEEYKPFLIGYDEKKNQTKKDFDGKEALNYKIKILSINTKKQNITKKIKKFNKAEQKEIEVMDGFPCFFATMGKEWKQSPKYFNNSDNLSVTIISTIEGFTDIIKSNFEKFIFETNFGTRQSKGFGSFTVINIDKKEIPVFKSDLYFDVDLNDIDGKVFTSVEYINTPDNYFQKQKKLFEIIDIFYKTLRSGINIKGKFYFKSLLFMYAKHHNITWDKKILKSKFVSQNEIVRQMEEHKPKNNDPLLHSSSNSFLVRDLLGLSTVQEWLSYKSRVRHPKEKGQDKLNGQIIQENNIKRFKSPITIKPVEINSNKFRINIILNEPNKNIFKEKITIIKTHDEGQGNNKQEKIDDKIDNLKFWNGFSLSDFFEYIKDEIDISQHIDKKFEKHQYCSLINNIYLDLKASK